MNKDNSLTLINPQSTIEKLSPDKLKRIHIKNEQIPKKKIGIQITSSGAFLGYESGQHVCQELEMEFYKD